MTDPSAIATGPSGNRNPVATTRTSAIAPYSPFLHSGILSLPSPERQAAKQIFNMLATSTGNCIEFSLPLHLQQIYSGISS
jgi:hypothetical protein